MNGHHQEVTFRWVAGILAAVVLALCGAWANHITTKVDNMQDAVALIRSDIAAIRGILRARDR